MRIILIILFISEYIWMYLCGLSLEFDIFKDIINRGHFYAFCLHKYRSYFIEFIRTQYKHYRCYIAIIQSKISWKLCVS